MRAMLNTIDFGLENFGILLGHIDDNDQVFNSIG